MDIITSDNSARHLLEQCERKYMLQQMCGLRGMYGSTALRYGTAWHAFLHGFYLKVMESGWEAKDLAFMAGLVEAKTAFEEESSKALFNDDYRTLENLNDSAYKYITHFEQDEFNLVVIGTEKIFEIEIEISELDRDHIPGLPEKVIFTGQIDLQVEMDGSKWIWEAKTTGGALSIESQRLHRLAQLMGYYWAAERVLEFKPQGGLISFHHLLSRKSSKDDSYGKVNIDFARIPHIFTEPDLSEWRSSFLHTAGRINQCMDTGFWPMRHDSCFDYNKRCSYASLCDMNRIVEFSIGKDGFYEIEPDRIPEGFKVERWDVRNRAKKGSITE